MKMNACRIHFRTVWRFICLPHVQTCPFIALAARTFPVPVVDADVVTYPHRSNSRF
jgi:hypothetical protein